MSIGTQLSLELHWMSHKQQKYTRLYKGPSGWPLFWWNMKSFFTLPLSILTLIYEINFVPKLFSFQFFSTRNSSWNGRNMQIMIHFYTHGRSWSKIAESKLSAYSALKSKWMWKFSFSCKPFYFGLLPALAKRRDSWMATWNWNIYFSLLCILGLISNISCRKVDFFYNSAFYGENLFWICQISLLFAVVLDLKYFKIGLVFGS